MRTRTRTGSFWMIQSRFGVGLKALGVSEDILREAVGHAGDEVEKVREYLGSGS